MRVGLAIMCRATAVDTCFFVFEGHRPSVIITHQMIKMRQLAERILQLATMANIHLRTNGCEGGLEKLLLEPSLQSKQRSFIRCQRRKCCRGQQCLPSLWPSCWWQLHLTALRRTKSLLASPVCKVLQVSVCDPWDTHRMGHPQNGCGAWRPSIKAPGLSNCEANMMHVLGVQLQLEDSVCVASRAC